MFALSCLFASDATGWELEGAGLRRLYDPTRY